MGNTNCCNSEGDKIQVRFQRQVIQIKGNIMEKILQIKAKIAEIKKVSLHSIILAYNGNILNDNQTLMQKQFKLSEDHLNASISTENDTSISITIRNINFTEKMEVKTTQTIKQIKKRIDRKHSIPHLSQRLIYNGMFLDDDSQVCKYGIQQGSVVHMCISLKG